MVNTMVNTMKRKSGLTVLEMLVVVAVIFLIAALLFPQFKKMRDTGKKMKCMANLKQLGIAVELYRQDDGLGRFPFWSGWPAPATCNFWGWDVKFLPEMLWSYLGSETITGSFGSGEMMHFRCPKNPETFQMAVREDVNGNIVDFHISCALIGEGYGEKVGNASITYLMIDFPTQAWPARSGNHNVGSNVLFVDGHVEYKTEAQLGSSWPNEDYYGGNNVEDWGIK